MTAEPGSISRRDFVQSAAGIGSGLLLGAVGCAGGQNRSTSGSSSLAQLRNRFDGTLVLPGDAGYDRWRRVASFNRTTDKDPAIIARCASASDVARALEHARSHGLEIAVRGGGHDVLGRSTCDEGMLIDVSPMSGVTVDQERGIARVAAGARAGTVNDALQAYGLAAALGCNPVVGIAGLTLGGGLGWLLGRYGAASDNVEAVDVITADGRQLRASDNENPDLFWGVRGGGGNFGIATAFEYRTHSVETVVGGYLVYSGAHAAHLLRVYRDVMADAPDELVVEIVCLASAEPPHPPVAVAIVCHSGDPTQAERVLAPLRRVGPPLIDAIQISPYARFTDPPPEVAPIFGVSPSGERPVAEAQPSGSNYWRGASLSNWSDAAIDAFLGRAASAPPGWSMGLGHYMHGAVCRVDQQATPLVRHEGSTSYYFNIGWGDPARSDAAIEWVDRSIGAMDPFAHVPTYINYLSAESGSAVAASYGRNYQRLRELKSRFDPDNVFHLNRNIRP